MPSSYFTGPFSQCIRVRLSTIRFSWLHTIQESIVLSCHFKKEKQYKRQYHKKYETCAPQLNTAYTWVLLYIDTDTNTQEKKNLRLVSLGTEELVVSATIFQNGDNENRAQRYRIEATLFILVCILCDKRLRLTATVILLTTILN